MNKRRRERPSIPKRIGKVKKDNKYEKAYIDIYHALCVRNGECLCPAIPRSGQSLHYSALSGIPERLCQLQHQQTLPDAHPYCPPCYRAIASRGITKKEVLKKSNDKNCKNKDGFRNATRSCGTERELVYSEKDCNFVTAVTVTAKTK